jgi:hypothetical protein
MSLQRMKLGDCHQNEAISLAPDSHYTWHYRTITAYQVVSRQICTLLQISDTYKVRLTGIHR